MSTEDDLWWDAQCGEYVLGTLRGAEREVIEKILLVDADAQARVTYWQNRLSSLDTYLPVQQPPEHVLPLIMGRLKLQESAKIAKIQNTDNAYKELVSANSTNTAKDNSLDLTGTWTEDIESVLAAEQEGTTRANHLESEKNATDFITLDDVPVIHAAQSRKGNGVWKITSLLATSVALLLGGLLLQEKSQNNIENAIPDSGSLSVLLDTEQQALWLITAVTQSDIITVIALSPPTLQSDQSYHLWVVKPDNAGVSSAGLLPRKTGQSSTIQLPAPISLAEGFAVSLEPAAGSPEPGPTGPVLFNASIQALGDLNQ